MLITLSSGIKTQHKTQFGLQSLTKAATPAHRMAVPHCPGGDRLHAAPSSRCSHTVTRIRPAAAASSHLVVVVVVVVVVVLRPCRPPPPLR